MHGVSTFYYIDNFINLADTIHAQVYRFWFKVIALLFLFHNHLKYEV
jgi:hypothetical protein